MKRRLRRWAVLGWALAVALGGGLTLWLQDTEEPQEPDQWRRAEHRPVDADADADCPGPGITPSPRSDGTIVLCAYATSR